MRQESVGIFNRRLAPATPHFVDRQGALSATSGLATGDLPAKPLGLQTLGEGEVLCKLVLQLALPATEVPNPHTPKVLGKVLGKVPAGSGGSGKCSGECLGRCLRGCLGECLSSYFSTRDKRTSTFASTFPSTLRSTFPSTPLPAGTSPSTSPSTFGDMWVRRLCSSQGQSQS